jgi:hypothetical protein
MVKQGNNQMTKAGLEVLDVYSEQRKTDVLK